MSLTSHSASLRRKRGGKTAYNHAQWELRRRFLKFLLRTIAFSWLIRLERVEGLENIPTNGPAILLMNHIAFVDPIILVHVVPRHIVPMAKIEVYKYPVIGIFPRLWGVIPVRREEFDRKAVQDALDVLRAGEIVLVAPEGTRNPQLQRGKEGMAYLASRSGSPVVPAAIEGTPGYPAVKYSRRWKEGGVSVRFGSPFKYHPEYQRAGREELRKMADEAMFVLAGLLSESRRGAYSDLSQATQDTITFIKDR
jgi:1-acyl-sn-glycerol-3-phosphate acyltransferase